MKVSIVGGSPGTEHDHPQDGEVWVLGNQYDRHLECPVTRIFEIHDDLSNQPKDYPEWLVKQGKPLTVGVGFPLQVKGVEIFPFDEANELLGGHLTSSAAYMMAYAILHGATRIEIYGVDMAVDDFEYFYQRPSMYAWIAYAKAKGIEVYIPEKSPLFADKHVEGKTAGRPDFSLPPFTTEELNWMAEAHGQKIDGYRQDIAHLETLIHTHAGAKQAYERLSKVARAVESGQEIDSLQSTASIV